MRKKFFIHSSIYSVKHLLFSLGYLAIAICWIILIFLEGPILIYRFHFIRFAVFISISILIFLYMCHILFITLQETMYVLTDESLIKKNATRAVLVSLSEVEVFRYIHLPFGLGFGFIQTSSKKIRLTFLIEHLSELLQSLEEYFTKENKRSVFQSREIDTFKHRALITEFNLRQTPTIVGPLMYIILSMMFLSLLTATQIWNLPVFFTIIWVLYSLLSPGISFIVAYFLITRRIAAQLKENPQVKPKYDLLKTYSYTALITLIIYLVSGIIYKNNWAFFF